MAAAKKAAPKKSASKTKSVSTAPRVGKPAKKLAKKATAKSKG